MNLKNPITPTIPNPVGLDLAIQGIQLALTSLPWLEKSFGRAREVNKVPMVYQGSKEYYPSMPNDALQSYSFFRVNMEREALDYTPTQTIFLFRAPVDIIFWFNLQRIDSQKDYIFTDELIQDVLNVLSSIGEITVKKVWDDKPENIFSNYDLSEKRDLLMYPYGAFRIETTLAFSHEC